MPKSKKKPSLQELRRAKLYAALVEAAMTNRRYAERLLAEAEEDLARARRLLCKEEA